MLNKLHGKVFITLGRLDEFEYIVMILFDFQIKKNLCKSVRFVVQSLSLF